MIRTERELAAVALGLTGKAVTSKDWQLIENSDTVERTVLEETRTAILAGIDPLGEAFCHLRSPRERRAQGAIYTPQTIVNAMISWAALEPEPPARIVDAGSGSGRFTMAAAKAFPAAELIAVEIDPLAALTLRANAVVLGFAKRLTVMQLDYRCLSLPKIDRPTLYIGNPPYVRHHDIAPKWKTWFGEAAASYGFTASKLAGLHIHFFLRTRQLAREGDFGAFITAAEWLDVNYGSLLRAMLADGLGGSALHVIGPKAQPFADVLTTGAITCFRVGRRPDELTIRSVESLDQLAPLSAGRAVPWSEIAAAPRWSVLTRRQPKAPTGYIELGEIFRVHRGQVTGANAVWIAGPHAPTLPVHYLLPAITKARELFAAGDVLTRTDHLRRVVDLPLDLSALTEEERGAVDRFLAWAKRAGAHQSYVATHRGAWWCVGYKEPAPILCTYMARRSPHFVLNTAGARHINIAHGLYPREFMSTADLDRIAAALRSLATVEGGRVYAGGLVKFEPKELERTRLPRLKDIDGYLADFKSLAKKVVPQGTAKGRRESDDRVSK